MSSDFVHLRFHSEYSLMDSCCAINKVKEESLKRSFSSLAITDTANIAGVIRFYKECVKTEDKDGNQLEQIKPILGSLVYITETDGGMEKHEKDDHMPIILLAKDNQGFENLKKISDTSHTAGFNEISKKPRIDHYILDKYREGLILISTDLDGPVQRLLRRKKFEDASAVAFGYKDMFGDDFYLEIQDNDQVDQEMVNKDIIEIGKGADIKIVATNDVRYYEQKHHKAHLVLQALEGRKTIKSRKFTAVRSDQRYFKTAEEMAEAINKYPDVGALKNTVEVAEKCNVKLTFGGMRLPEFKLPDGFETDWHYLKHLAFEGLKQRGLADKQEYIDRLKEELFDVRMVNETKGYNFARYFLIVWDYANQAQDNGCRIGIGRGCFTPDNLVICKDGNKNISDVEVGDMVLSYDGKYHEVLNTLEYHVDEEILDIEVDDGRIISCTKDHKIHVERNGELMWIQANELEENDDIFDIET